MAQRALSGTTRCGATRTTSRCDPLLDCAHGYKYSTLDAVRTLRLSDGRCALTHRLPTLQVGLLAATQALRLTSGVYPECALRLQYRWGVYKNVRAHIDEAEGGMDNFTSAYNHFGLNRGEHEGRQGIWYREWAPGAQAVALIGEFNNWDPQDDHWATKSEYGTFALFLPDQNGTPQVAHRCGRVILSA